MNNINTKVDFGEKLNVIGLSDNIIAKNDTIIGVKYETSIIKKIIS